MSRLAVGFQELHDGLMATNEPLRASCFSEEPGVPDLSEAAVEELARAIYRLNHELIELDPPVVNGRPGQELSWRDVWPQFRIDLVEETARCVADNQSIATRGGVPRWAQLSDQTRHNLIENIARIFLAQDQAMHNLIEKAEADGDWQGC